MSRHIAVLKGGLSPEREVSLVSGSACAKALRAKGYDVTEIDMAKDLWDQLSAAKPDVIFNALHGEWGEDGRVQGVLDLYGVPYTHSGVMASALAMDKQRTKAVLHDEGIASPRGFLAETSKAAGSHLLEPPYVIKPNAQGSSVGVIVVQANDNRAASDLGLDPQSDELVLVETYAPGRELTVAVLGDRPLAVTEILPATEFYDYEAKYSAGGSTHICPADIPDDIAETCKDWALRAHAAIGCKGLTRSDFRYDPDTGRILFLEINTQPGMTPTSLAPEQAAHVGMSFEDLCEWIVEDASCPR